MTSPRPPKEPAVGETVRFTHELALPASVPVPHVGMRFDKAVVLISKAYLEGIAASTDYPEDASDARLMLHHAAPSPDGILSRQQFESGGLDKLDLIRIALESGNAAIKTLSSGWIVPRIAINYFGMRSNKDAELIGLIHYDLMGPEGGNGPESKKLNLFAVAWFAERRLGASISGSGARGSVSSGSENVQRVPEAPGALARPRRPEEPAIGETVDIKHRFALPASVPLPRVSLEFARTLVSISKSHLEQLGTATEHSSVASAARRLLEQSRNIPDGVFSRFDPGQSSMEYLDLVTLAFEEGHAMLRSRRAGLEKEIREVSIWYNAKRPTEDIRDLGSIHCQFNEPLDESASVTNDRLFARTPFTPLFVIRWQSKSVQALEVSDSTSYPDVPDKPDLSSRCEEAWLASEATDRRKGSGPPAKPGIGEIVHVTYERTLPASVPYSRIVISFGQSLLGISKDYLEKLGASTEHPDLAPDARRLLKLASTTPDNSLFRRQVDQGGLGDLKLIRWCLENGNAIVRSMAEEILSVSITYRGIRADETTRVMGTITYEFDVPRSKRMRPARTAPPESDPHRRMHLFMVPWYSDARWVSGTSPSTAAGPIPG